METSVMEELWNRIKVEYHVKTNFFSTILFFLVAHGYGMANYSPLHDSVMMVSCDDIYQYSYGRWAVPFYYEYIRNRINTTWFTVWVCCVAIFVLACMISNLLNLNKYQCVFVSGILTVNMTLMSQFAAYMQGGDTEGISLLLACLTVFVVDKCTNKLARFAGALGLCFSLGLYQANINTAIGLILIIMIVRAIRGEYVSFKDYVRYGLTQLFYMVVGCVYYLLVLKLLQWKTGIGMGGGYNGPGRLLELSKKELIVEVFKGIGYSFEYFNKYFFGTLPSRVQGVYMLLFIISGILLIVQLIQMRHNKLAVIEAVIALVLFPLGINAMFAMSMGVIHRVMVYSYNMVLVLMVVIAGEAITPEVKVTWLPKVHGALRCGVSLLLVVYLFMNSLYINDVYFYKHRVYEKTALATYDIYTDLCNMQGFEPLKTEIVVVHEGEDEDNFAYRQQAMEDIIYEGGRETGIVDSSLSFFGVFGWFFSFIHGVNLRFVQDTQVEQSTQVNEMPCYPYDGYMQWLDDNRIVIKLSRDLEETK